MTSGLYEELAAKRLLVAHTEVDVPGGAAAADPAAPRAFRTLKPDLVPFVSHPYEWCFGQLKAAALLTLRVQRIALKHGMTLRDASAFNVQFVGARPVFIDTLSFDRYVEGRPWVGYRQFCQHFLAPLYLVAGRDPRLSALSASWIDGIPLDVARVLAPLRYRLAARVPRAHRPARPGAAAVPGRRRAARAVAAPPARGAAQSPRQPAERRRAALLEPRPDAPGRATTRTPTTPTRRWRSKKRFVAAVVDGIRPSRVVDLGANTGEFSAIAARAGAYVVASDIDHGAVEICFRRESAEEASAYCRSSSTWRALRRVSGG